MATDRQYATIQIETDPDGPTDGVIIRRTDRIIDSGRAALDSALDTGKAALGSGRVALDTALGTARGTGRVALDRAPEVAGGARFILARAQDQVDDMSDMGVVAAAGFSSAADVYERARPSYPADAVAWLVEVAQLAPGRVVVDVGAGTGKLTRLLVPTGARVIAVEPVAEMRAKLTETTPGVELLDGVAEALPLEDASVDALTVAQAFHWFDYDAALPELHRVLRPDGPLVLIWNSRDLDDPLQAGIEELLQPLRGAVSAQQEGAWRAPLE